MANVDKAREHLTALLGVFVARYKLGEPPYDSAGANAIEAAIEAGKGADLAGLRRMLTEDYNLYAHHEAQAIAALDAAEAALTDLEQIVSDSDMLKPLHRQNKTRFLATAASRGIEVPEGATVPQLREALSPAGFETSDETEEEEGDGESDETSGEEEPEEPEEPETSASSGITTFFSAQPVDPEGAPDDQP